MAGLVFLARVLEHQGTGMAVIKPVVLVLLSGITVTTNTPATATIGAKPCGLPKVVLMLPIGV